MTMAVTGRDQFRRLAILITTNMVDMIGFMIVVPLLPFYALDMHATPETIGWIIAAFSISQLVASPLWGRVSDRFGRRPVLLISLTSSAAAFMIFGLADTIGLLFVSRIVQGIGGGTTGVAQAYVADTIPPAQRARALGWLSAATAAGVIIGPAIGSLASHLGQEAPGFLAAGLCLVNVGFAWKWLPESRVHSAVGYVRRPVWHAAWNVIRHPIGPVPRLIWIYAVGMLAFTSMTASFALYLEAEYGITTETIGYFFVYIGALSFVMRSLLLGPVVDRIGEHWSMRAGAAALVVGLTALPMVHSVWLLIAILPLVPVGTALLFPSTTSLMSQLSPVGDTGTVMGTAQTYAGISRVIAPVGATIAFQRLGHGMPFLLGAAMVGLVSLMTFRIRRTTVEDDPALESPVP